MNEVTRYNLTDEEKDALINALTDELPALRAKAEISQEEIANLVGVSRQTYGAIERKARKMSWNTYLSFILFYDYNKNTHDFIRHLSAFPHTLIKRFNKGQEPHAFEMDMLFDSDEHKILSALDERALATIKNVLMIEYSRCNNLPSEAVVKFFEGISFTSNSVNSTDESTAKALSNIKRDRKNGSNSKT